MCTELRPASFSRNHGAARAAAAAIREAALVPPVFHFVRSGGLNILGVKEEEGGCVHLGHVDVKSCVIPAHDVARSG